MTPTPAPDAVDPNLPALSLAERTSDDLAGMLDFCAEDHAYDAGRRLMREAAVRLRSLTPSGRVPALPDGGERQAVVDVVAAVRRDDVGRYWLCRRSADGANAGLAGMWEYPGGKVEAGEQLREALVREMREEFGWPSEVTVGIGAVLDNITYGKYRVTFFEVTMAEPTELRSHTEVRWMTPDEACRVEHLPSGMIFTAKHLASAPPERGTEPRPVTPEVNEAWIAEERKRRDIERQLGWPTGSIVRPFAGDEAEAIRLLQRIQLRLKELGWRDAMYAPKDGSTFDCIEVGCTAVLTNCTRDEIGFWHHDTDTWPMCPILFRAALSRSPSGPDA